jgi:hypothetical protein
MASPSHSVAEFGRQFLARPRQARHDGADRQIEHRRDMLVRKILDLAQHEDLARLGRQRRERRRDLAPPVARQRALLGIGTFGGPVLDLLERAVCRAVAGNRSGAGAAGSARSIASCARSWATTGSRVSQRAKP